ncbi:MAG: cation diffusion facilitator family transporter [Bacteroidota bacterium]
MKETHLKTKTARLSILSNSLLILLKIISGILSGSVSIISEAIHSSLDLLAAIIAFFAVKISGQGPDEKHPYGHGKFENLSGVIEAILILVASGWIIFEAVKRFGAVTEIEHLEVGMLVMFISSLVNLLVSRRLYKVAKMTDSIALEADALHLKADVFTSLGVAVGLLLILITDLHIIDPIIAILVAIFIIREAFILLRKAYNPLLDTGLNEIEKKVIEENIQLHLSEGMSFHRLRTRRSGHIKYVDFHLEVPPLYSVKQAHDLCDLIEEDLKKLFPYIEIDIHTEPLGD